MKLIIIQLLKNIMRSFTAALLLAASQVIEVDAVEVESAGLSPFIIVDGAGRLLSIGDEGCILDDDHDPNSRGRRTITVVRSRHGYNRNGERTLVAEIVTDSESCGPSDPDSYHSSNTFSDASCNDSDNIPCDFYKGRNHYGRGPGHHW